MQKLHQLPCQMQQGFLAHQNEKQSPTNAARPQQIKTRETGREEDSFRKNIQEIIISEFEEEINLNFAFSFWMFAVLGELKDGDNVECNPTSSKQIKMLYIIFEIFQYTAEL